MNRTLLLVLFAGFSLTGCTRNADPLEWRIASSDPEELQEWLGENLPLMPNALVGELVVCLNNVRASTPLGPVGSPAQKEYRTCRRLDGHTVREVLIEGHELANRLLVARITNESDAVVRLLSTADTLNPEQLKKHEALMNAHLAVRATLEQRLRQGEERIAGLRIRPGSPAARLP